MDIKEMDAAYLLTALKKIFAEQQESTIGIPEESSRYLTLGAFAGEALVGGIVIEIKYETAHISLLALRPDFQKAGIGTALLKKGEAAAQEAGAKTVTLTTRSYQAPEFYRKQGYKCFGKLADVPMTGVTKYYFVKRLVAKDSEKVSPHLSD